ncbi:hypothetical protein B0I35DRAFT_3371 [Stachybotrys elegans]|uniref:Amino-acid acetyltransferase, mitochondrial n=1 Tax=Stachybotrys elegans TaxID=80388 RepID=A0A8K0T100_9HYPO|nr:hypothetical protein B0I35DRAFT_3371 [Stachybotrys elegans]
MNWIFASKKASSCGHLLPACKGGLHGHIHARHAHQRHALAPAAPSRQGHSSSGSTTVPSVPLNAPASSVRSVSSPSASRWKQQRALGRDVLVSVLEASATRRDAKGYLKTYTLEDSEAIPPLQSPQESPNAAPLLHVAILKLRAPQDIDQETLHGVARTVTQLKVLGLLSIVVVDCGPDETRDAFQHQAMRLCNTLESFGRPAAKPLDNVFIGSPRASESSPSFLSGGIRVSELSYLKRCLMQGLIPVIPSLACHDELSASKPVDSNEVVLALTRYLVGYQFPATDGQGVQGAPDLELSRPEKIAAVERIMILDPLGGTPEPGRPGACHRFINLEQEYDTLVKLLVGPEGSPVAEGHQSPIAAMTHAANLSLAKEALAMLPASSSAIITTPFAAANNAPSSSDSVATSNDHSALGFDGMVVTRKRQNPLLHNLLTDKPVYSSSLPAKRIQNGQFNQSIAGATTLVKRGLPLTIFPNPRTHPWTPPKPGSPRLRLTDKCIDMPRLVHLIEDSFNRKLDVQDYLNRVNENLAGIIIAGEYEGGAILTWEKPADIDMETAYRTGRFVPYLDKFAVLKSQQGSGGVADIVFNAMVRDCFPSGVCWRSRKDNPVNKWYFERSWGTNKLSDSNWTMFWTTTGLNSNHPTLRDYESVCRSVEPSWADQKHIVD